jgi:hypothetical protein
MNLSFLRNNDARLLAQTADPALRKEEIARLSGGRLRTAFGAALMFALLLVQMLVLPSSDTTWIYSFVLTGMFVQFYELQNRIRLLLLAEQIYAQQNRLAVGTP